jgi:hypothetical protein
MKMNGCSKRKAESDVRARLLPVARGTTSTPNAVQRLHIDSSSTILCSKKFDELKDAIENAPNKRSRDDLDILGGHLSLLPVL